MPASRKRLLASVLGYALMAASTALAEEIPHERSIALIDKAWAVRLDMTGYRIQADGVKPDSRRYLLATNNAGAIQLSVTLEAVSGQATEQGCLAHLTRIAHRATAASSSGPTRTEIHQVPILEYLLYETGGQGTGQLHLFACTVKENVYTDIHLSQSDTTTADASPLRNVLASLSIVDAVQAGSLDYFRAGSAPYLQGHFTQAILHYERAVALERANPVLDKSLWRLLVHNLGLAYRRTGDFVRAKTTIDYGLSHDPSNPFFHYDLARTYAGMNERDRAMQSLHDAFQHFHESHRHDAIPDPRQDVSFGRLMLDPEFRTLTESLMQPAI